MRLDRRGLSRKIIQSLLNRPDAQDPRARISGTVSLIRKSRERSFGRLGRRSGLSIAQWACHLGLPTVGGPQGFLPEWEDGLLPSSLWEGRSAPRCCMVLLGPVAPRWRPTITRTMRFVPHRILRARLLDLVLCAPAPGQGWGSAVIRGRLGQVRLCGQPLARGGWSRPPWTERSAARH